MGSPGQGHCWGQRWGGQTLSAGREGAPTPALEPWRGTRGGGWPPSLSPEIPRGTWDGAQAGPSPVGSGAETGPVPEKRDGGWHSPGQANAGEDRPWGKRRFSELGHHLWVQPFIWSLCVTFNIC